MFEHSNASNIGIEKNFELHYHFEMNRILIIEDDAEIAELLASFLNKNGFTALEAHRNLKRNLFTTKIFI